MDVNRSVLVLVLVAIAAVTTVKAQQASPGRRAPPMPHPAAGKEACLECHRPGANEHIKGTPANHAFANVACAMCHRAGPTAPPNIPHDTGDAFAECRMCHAADGPPGIPVPPASHEGFHGSICTICHRAASP